MFGPQGPYPTEDQWHEIWLRHPATAPGLSQDESSQVYLSLGIDPRHAKSAGRWGYVTLTDQGRVRGSGVGTTAVIRILEWSMLLPGGIDRQPPAVPAGTCPSCGSAGVPIVYGFPSDGAMRAGAAGALAFGGCVVGDEQPNWRCAAGHEWLDGDVDAWRARLESILAAYGSKESPMTRQRAADTCPTCGGVGVPLRYGYPTTAARRAHQAGEIALGGCDVPEDVRHWRCRQNHEWRDDDQTVLRQRIAEVFADHEPEVVEEPPF